ncbi:polyprenyl synthetase family protein [Lactobacillus sp. YT155]|uniref:polyprenyl synthetase family protein n=1 Tax=Lactobacillus sp. YT155 TaxID=3060955 RepID=UPI00265DD92D|nr:farnesyl diphosphate synthase [Lactobacillus sp. YT155]MDO1605555.1 polyprenyl synthetase family protein [Lactobacillus sp. YT155]
MNNFQDFQHEHAEKLILTADNLIDQKVNNRELAESMRYSFDAGGKRIRPILFLATLQTFGVNQLSNYYDVAASLELIHTYSLIHDDLPEMDNDDLRRGKPTNHKVYGTGSAVLAGDALLTMAFEFISNNEVITAQQKIELVKILSTKAGANGMISGQWLDINNTGHVLDQSQLEKLHKQKTGDLLLASLEMALALVEASDRDYAEISQFGKKIGLAFQVKDDILDVTSTTEQLGKKAQKDSVEGKNTYPSLLGLEGAKKYLQELRDSAQDNLDRLSVSSDLLTDFLKYFDLGE